MTETLKRYVKTLAALAGTVTPAAVIAFAADHGLALPDWAAFGIVGALGALAVAVAPANAEKVALVEQEPYEVPPCEECPASACDGCPLR